MTPKGVKFDFQIRRAQKKLSNKKKKGKGNWAKNFSLS